MVGDRGGLCSSAVVIGSCYLLTGGEVPLLKRKVKVNEEVREVAYLDCPIRRYT